jgi:hypothetical protein
MFKSVICHVPVESKISIPTVSWKPPVTLLPYYNKLIPNEIEIESQRRDAIVKGLALKFLTTFKIGQTVMFIGQPSVGKIIVTHICKRYSDLGKNSTWPKNDNPMIVSLFHETTHKVYHAAITAIKAS